MTRTARHLLISNRASFADQKAGLRTSLSSKTVAEVPGSLVVASQGGVRMWRLLGGAFLIALLAFLAWASSYLSAVRMYQVDECQNLYMARVLATGKASEFFTNASCFLLGPLSWITRSNLRTEEMFAAGRLLFLGVFWLNIFLLARIVSQRLFSLSGLVALAAAATLAPLWDYGFEIRHDNLLLSGMLITWWAIRARPMGLFSYALAGSLSVAMLFIAVKAAVYALPLSLAILIFPPRAFIIPRWRLVLAWLCGAVAAVAFIRCCYGTNGAWNTYLSVFHGVAKYSAGGGGGSPRFGPWFAISRLPGQTPLLLAGVAAACVATAVGILRKRVIAALSWETNLPEFLLFIGVVVALFLNPSPFPYNLLHVVPYAFLFGFRYGAKLWQAIPSTPSCVPVAVSILVFAHFVPFGTALKRHFDFPGGRQNTIINLAEKMTDPIKDPVYDGIGMVLTRPSINYNWYLHSLNIERFISGSGPKLHDMLAEHPAAVLIPNYRTDWLPEADHEFIRQRYVNLSDDFCVLGKQLPVGGGEFEIFHSGRYRISALKDSNIAGTYSSSLEEFLSASKPELISGTVDGVSLPDGPVELSEGKHWLVTGSTQPLALVWVGPKLDRPPRLGPGDHLKLFVNWY